MQSDLNRLRELVRDVPDFPKAGIVFKDITPVLADPKGLAVICDALTEPHKKTRIDKVLAIESRGFFLGAGVAERLGVGFVPVRKKGKLPWKTVTQSYALEYGEAVLELHEDAVKPGENVIIVDDVLATGGTFNAAHALVERLGGKVHTLSCLIEIEVLGGRKKVRAPLQTLWSI